MHNRIVLLLWVATSLFGCARVEVATDEPIVVEIRVKVDHEVRVRLDEEVAGMVSAERDRAQVGGRGLGDLPPLIADARDLEQAKLEGRVGETSRGYVASVSGDSDAALVERANARRRAEYQQLATAHQASLEDVEAIAGARRLRDSAPGAMVQDATGRWRRQPPGTS